MNEGLDKNKHPRGLSDEDKAEWHKLCDRLFQLYRKMPMGATKRKIVCGGDGKESIMCFFLGDETDAYRLKNFLNHDH